MIPDTIKLETEHISHPFAGPPFGPTSEEDSLNQINGMLMWEKGNLYMETGLGYKYRDGGFYGPELTFTGRAGVKFDLKH